jgi:hypothetical protein
MSLVLQSSGGGSVTLAEPTTASNFTQDLPAVTGNVVIDSATQTLTNKTIEGGTVISGTAVASTSGTSIDFTGIPSWVKRITVMFNGVSTSGTSNLLIQLGDAGGVENTGYTGTSVITGNSAAGAAANYSAGFLFNFASAAVVQQGLFTLATLGGNAWAGQGIFGRSDTASICQSAGRKTLSDVLDRVRITTVNGTDTFDAGSINILYE